jgi:hypothetical protein
MEKALIIEDSHDLAVSRAPDETAARRERLRVLRQDVIIASTFFASWTGDAGGET